MSWQQAFRAALSPETAARLEAHLGHPIVPILRLICSWCQRVIREGSINAPISHGACPDCLKKLNAEMDAEDARRVA